jgi:anti-sigma B factor antagonist
VLQIHITGADPVTVTVRGELDLPHAAQLRAAITDLLNRGGMTTINLDIEDVTFVDSTGLGTLVVAHRVCRTAGVTLRLTAVNPFAARLLTVVGAEILLSPALTPAG